MILCFYPGIARKLGVSLCTAVRCVGKGWEGISERYGLEVSRKELWHSCGIDSVWWATRLALSAKREERGEIVLSV